MTLQHWAWLTEEVAMADRAFSTAREHAPWREGTPWWVTGLEGVVLVIIGLYLLLAPNAAGGVLIQLIALILLIASALHIVAAFRAPGAETDRYQLLQAGIGATVGLLLVLQNWLLPTLDADTATNMLGFGLIAYAVVGLAGALLARGAGESWLSPLINGILLIILAIVLLTSNESNAVSRLGFLGWIALIGGAILLFLAWRLRGSSRTA
jgi:uncharacterized membrane protein HdeD (DUF308 family)